MGLMMKKKIKRSRHDLLREVKEQLILLQNACEKYDEGVEAFGKHIALSLRVLLHQHGQSRSLLEQLGMLNIKLYDTGGHLDLRNLLTSFKLVTLEISPSGGRYKPKLVTGPRPEAPVKVNVTTWWNDPVLKDKQGRLFNRRQLILNVADTDGGAHVDPELDEAYMDLSRNNSLGWIFGYGKIEQAFEGRPELACMRQIAHELLTTLKESYPELFR